MKKIFLTGCAAALFSIATIAQDKDTTQNQSNEFRNTEQQQQQTNPAPEAIDSTATDFQQGVNETEREAEQAGENIRQESQNLKNDAEKTGEKIEQGAEETSDDLKNGLNRAGDKIEQGAEKTGDKIQQGANKTGNKVQQGVERAGNEIQQGNPDEKKGQMKDNAGNKMNEKATANTGGSELEVVEAKEGPQNEVVYKYQGELFYIDRVEKKLVKADESALKDAKHQVIIKENMNSTESAKENTKRRKSNN